MKALTPAVSLLLTLTLLVPLSLAYRLPSVEAGPRRTTLTLNGNFFGWNLTTNVNPTIATSHGFRVTVHLTSSDGLLHQFFVDVNGNGSLPDCNVDKCSSPFGGTFASSTTYKFRVGFAAGTYTYYCSLHPLTMRGTFLVGP